jgi:hypothetical protein
LMVMESPGWMEVRSTSALAMARTSLVAVMERMNFKTRRRRAAA